ncbi:MAG TPA: alpha/beta fold hydrolase [Ideonella sp.]|nr:alpha/beta fold hydrolase [Ideonella sp.]
MTPAGERLDALDARARHHRVDHQGRNVHWRQWGEGPPLVLLHGGHGSWAHWVRNIETLSQRHTLWLPDMPAYGDSDDLPRGLHPSQRLPALVETLAGSLSRLLGALTPIALAGFSFGGLVAAQLAVQRGHVRRLALLGTAGHGGVRRPMAELLNWRSDDPAAMQAALRHNLAALMLHDPAQIDELAMQVHERSCLKTRFRSKAISRASPLPALLAGCDAPLLLLWGEHDVTAHPEQVGPQLTQGHPERAWRAVPGAGHWLQYEQAAATDRLLLAWFDASTAQALPT